MKDVYITIYRIATVLAAGVVILFGAGCKKNIPVRPIRVMSYNIHYGADASGALNLDRVANVISGSGADIAALQEVDRVWGKRSGYMDEAAYLSEALGMEFAFGATLDRQPDQAGVGEFGVMILSKFPIASWEFHFLPSSLEQRGVLLAWIDIYGERIPVACTHLGLSGAERANQIADALAWLPDDERLFLLGDFNAEPAEPEILDVKRRFHDIQEYHGLGGEGTFFYEGRRVRIDYIFARTKWRTAGFHVIQERASDHYPVVAEILPVPLDLLSR
ncbi:MAG: endonuclease/exonuclease/phosphatase family protein [Bacillota bacterium]